MEAQQSNQTENAQFSELGQRMARMETKMDFVATHKNLAEVRTKTKGTRAETASLKGTSHRRLQRREEPTGRFEKRGRALYGDFAVSGIGAVGAESTE